MSLDAYEIRCAGSSGTDRLCRKKVGAAHRTEWGYLEFEGTFIGDGPYETDDYILRFHCPVHGDIVGYANEFGDNKVYWAYKQER